MEERKTQAREIAGGRASAAARWLPVLRRLSRCLVAVSGVSVGLRGGGGLPRATSGQTFLSR